MAIVQTPPSGIGPIDTPLELKKSRRQGPEEKVLGESLDPLEVGHGETVKSEFAQELDTWDEREILPQLKKIAASLSSHIVNVPSAKKTFEATSTLQSQHSKHLDEDNKKEFEREKVAVLEAGKEKKFSPAVLPIDLEAVKEEYRQAMEETKKPKVQPLGIFARVSSSVSSSFNFFSEKISSYLPGKTSATSSKILSSRPSMPSVAGIGEDPGKVSDELSTKAKDTSDGKVSDELPTKAKDTSDRPASVAESATEVEGVGTSVSQKVLTSGEEMRGHFATQVRRSGPGRSGGSSR